MRIVDHHAAEGLAIVGTLILNAFVTDAHTRPAQVASDECNLIIKKPIGG